MRGYFIKSLMILCCCLIVHKATAQDITCPKGYEPDGKGGCRRIKIKPPPPSSAKLCSIKVQIKGEAKGVAVTLTKNQGDCPANKRGIKADQRSFGKREYVDGGGETSFSGFLCACNHTLTVQDNDYDFSDGGSKNVIAPRPDEIFSFTATRHPKAEKPSPPCHEEIEPSPLKLGAELADQVISVQLACKEQRYYKDYKLRPEISGSVVSVNLTSDDPEALQFEIFQDENPTCEELKNPTPQLRTRQCRLHKDRDYILRVTATRAPPFTLKYDLKVSFLALTAIGYRGQLDKAVSKLGSVNTPVSTPPIFNSLNQQIALLKGESVDGGKSSSPITDPEAKEKLQTAIEMLQELAVTKTEAPEDDQALVSAALGVIYRYYLADAQEAKKWELRAINLGGGAWFRIKLNDKKKIDTPNLYWVVVKKSEIAIKRLIDDRNIDKFFNEVRNPTMLDPTHKLKLDDADRRGNWFLEFNSLQKKPYYIFSTFKDGRGELNTIKELMESALKNSQRQ